MIQERILELTEYGMVTGLVQAEDKVYLSDFDNSLYIAYDGTPLIPIEDNWTPKQILEELSKLRQNYVNSKMKNYKPTFLESLFKSPC